MTNVYSFDGIVVFGLLFICTCAYLKKVPRLNSWLLSEKKGVWGVFYKGETSVNQSSCQWSIYVIEQWTINTGYVFLSTIKELCYSFITD
uniref:Protein kish n=1 Tax=Hucho hucho TaxID=62062 RepID=A0A4W5PWA2_9TELE